MTGTSSEGRHHAATATASRRRTVVSASTEIAAPPHIVFAILANPHQHARIDGSGSVRKTIEGPDRLTPGSEFRVSMKLYGLRYANRNRVVELEPDRLIAWRHWAPHRWRYQLDPTSGGSTRVTEACDFSSYPAWGMAIARMMRWPSRNQAWIERSLANLKLAAEANAAAATGTAHLSKAAVTDGGHTIPRHR